MMPTKEALTHAAHFLEEDGYKCRHCVPVAEFLSKLASGWVLVLDEPIGYIEAYFAGKSGPMHQWTLTDLRRTPRSDSDVPLYAAAPKP